MNTRAPATPPKTLAWALLTAGIALSDAVMAAEAAPPPSATDLAHQWAQWVVYAVTPYCQVLANGLRVCQPIGLVGPAPNSPAAAYQPLVRVPLAPPAVQPPGMPSYAYPPYGGNPYLPGQAMPTLPWRALPGSPQQPAAAPLASAQTGAGLPSIVQPAVPAEAPAASPAPVTSEPPAQQLAPTPAAPATAVTMPPAPAVAAPATETAMTEAAAAAADAAIAHFEFDRAELTETGRAALDAWLARHAKGTRVVVTGHADRLGPAPYNLDLSRRRAEAARDYLVKNGMDPRLISIVAKGETQPVTHCKGRPTPATIDCLAPNRRVVIAP